MAKIPAPAPAAPAAAPVASAKPGTADTVAVKAKKPKTKKAKKAAYPGLYGKNEAGEEVRVKLKAIPTDYDPKTHKPFSRKDFDDQSLWFELRARACEVKAAEWRKRGEEEKSLEGNSEKAKTKRALKMQAKYAEILADLRKSLGNEVVDKMLAENEAKIKAAQTAETQPTA